MWHISTDFAWYWCRCFSNALPLVCTVEQQQKIELDQNKSINWRSSYHWVVWERTTHPEYPSQLRGEGSWQLGKQCYQTLLAPNHCFCQLLQQTLLGFHLLWGGRHSEISNPPCSLPLIFMELCRSSLCLQSSFQFHHKALIFCVQLPPLQKYLLRNLNLSYVNHTQLKWAFLTLPLRGSLY